MIRNRRTRKVKTTLGELIVALTDEARLCVRDEREANRLVADIMADLLDRSVSAGRR